MGWMRYSTSAWYRLFTDINREFNAEYEPAERATSFWKSERNFGCRESCHITGPPYYSHLRLQVVSIQKDYHSVVKLRDLTDVI